MDNQKKILLVIEDDLYTRDLYKEILETAGYTVETAVDGVEGLQKVQSGAYNLVILDIMLPKKDGLSLLTSIKENPPPVHSPIIVLTNLARDPVLKEALSLGAKACLIKTDLNPDQLISKVNEFVEKPADNTGN